ncbi:uncharacterized protein LOC129787270 [Lutzomyia longipalpis]|uniref:uncharacterized protein LOC129787270 n=1 Tax=Lutzomyia longipalpis TaxID=7200 RepID=UPI0024834ADA|nr:uncharacterized protein LOC129787270 [Lutzomyia longipalpis]XP_055678701.1 uncharacterized protein LOC129787270 [Lutzomyia longipalpis]
MRDKRLIKMQLKVALFWTLCCVAKLNSAQESGFGSDTTYDNIEDPSGEQRRFVGYKTTIYHESATFSNPTEPETDTIENESTSIDTSQRIDTTITENTDFPSSETIIQDALIVSNELTLRNDSTSAGEDTGDFQEINGEDSEAATVTAAVPTTIMVPTTPSTTTTTTTVHPSIKALNLKRKQTKQYRVYKSTGDGIVRSFLDDPYLRSPLAILVDTAPEPLRKAKLLWNATLRPASSIDLVLVAFNASGISVTYNFKNTRTMMAGMESVRESHTPGSEEKAFIGIIRASELIPYDSAIFLTADRVPQNSEFSQEAAIILLKKRIRLYLIWFGKHGQDDNESPHTITGGILGEVALRTGGEIIHITDEAVEPNGNIGLVTLLLRNDLQGSHHFTLPIDATAETNHHVKIHGKVDEATLETPNRAPRSAQIQFVDGNDRIESLENDVELLDDQEDAEIETTEVKDTKVSERVIESVLTVNISPQSRLMTSPGTTAMIYFEVTNLRYTTLFMNFQAVDEHRFLRTINPPQANLGPGQTLVVTVVLQIPPTVEVGLRDRVTFTANGIVNVVQSVYVTVSSATSTQDSSAPWMYWTYGSRCEWRSSPGNCAGHVWSVEVSAQDWETGVLRIQSQPRGLLYRNQFTAGTRDPVLATYSASCCQPRVTITAFDLANNQKSISLDVRDIWLSEAAIAAVVLGCILLIILIVLLIFLCRWCYQRKRASRDLPVYRTERTRMEQR